MTALLTDVSIFQANGHPFIDKGWIRVDGDHVGEIGIGDPGTIGPDFLRIAGAGRTVLPGLIDAHVHLAGFHATEREGDPSPRTVADDTLRVVTGAARLLAGGVTTVRDCGYPHHAIFAVREAIEAGDVPGPRLVLSGRAIAATAGHGAWLSAQVTGPDEVRRAVRTEAKAGADWIKLMVTGGTATPGEAISDIQLTLDELRAAVEEAHARGRRVSAHCSNLPGATRAVDAGVDTIEHGIVIDDELAKRMAGAGVGLASTLLCTQIEGTAGPESGIPEHVRHKGADAFRKQQHSFQRALAAGVSIAAGTDAQVPYLPLEAESLARELAVMVSLGMSPTRALESCTSDAARLLGIESDVGTLEPGRKADLIIVDGNPTTDVSVVARPMMVMRSGRIAVDRLSVHAAGDGMASTAVAGMTRQIGTVVSED